MKPGPRQGQAGPVNRHCRVCGEWHDNCVTCLNESRRVDAQKVRAKNCEACGAEMQGAPSALANKRWCRAECKPKPALPAKACLVCGHATDGKRKTCSDGCLKVRKDAHAALLAKPGRTPAQRRARARGGYKGKDKAEVTARLLASQRER